MNVLVTGATGFVGRAVVRRLVAAGHRVRAAVREPSRSLPEGVARVEIGDIDGATDWAPAIGGIDAVVHLAARVHVVHESLSPEASLAAFRRVNRDGVRRLAESCAPGTRIVAMSSIRAVVDECCDGVVDSATSPRPTTPYGRSKLEGEEALAEVAARRGLSWIALRPPLVVGEGAGGNLDRLFGLVRSRVPLPLGAVTNRRSFIYVGNLADAVMQALQPDAPEGRAVAIADPGPRSTADLARAIGVAMDRQPRMIRVDPRVLSWGAKLLRKQALWDRLAGDLEIADEGGVALHWRAAVGFEEGVRRSVVAWLQGRS